MSTAIRVVNLPMGLRRLTPAELERLACEMAYALDQAGKVDNTDEELEYITVKPGQGPHVKHWLSLDESERQQWRYAARMGWAKLAEIMGARVELVEEPKA